MKDQRLLVSVFCDDIRNEFGGKLTLVGCYAADLLLPQLPAVLPKFAAYVRVYTPVALPLSRLRLRMLFNSEVLGELEVDRDHLERAAQAEIEPEATWRINAVVLMVSPINLNEPGEIRVEAETESGALIPARLKVRTLTPEQLNHAVAAAMPLQESP